MSIAEFFKSLDQSTTTRVIVVALVLLVGWVAAKFASRWVANLMARRFDQHQSQLGKRLTFYLVMAMTIVTALREAGIDLSVVIGAAGVASVAVGFASQTSMSNLISGLFMVIEKPFKVGDVIRIGATTGEVSLMGLLSTNLKTAENVMVRLPNEYLMKSEIANLTRFQTRKSELVFFVNVNSDLDAVRKILLESTAAVRSVLTNPAPGVAVRAMSDTSIQVVLSIWTRLDVVGDATFEVMSLAKQSLEKGGVSVGGSRSQG